jgi:hypothetical protein
MGPLRVAFYLLVPGILLLLRIADEGFDVRASFDPLVLQFEDAQSTRASITKGTKYHEGS